MKYMVRKSIVEVIGHIWQPGLGLCAYRYDLRDPYDVDNARDDAGSMTRESVQHWLSLNAGDFQSIRDFHASIEDGQNTVEIPWDDEESELTYGDCMFPNEE